MRPRRIRVRRRAGACGRPPHAGPRWHTDHGAADRSHLQARSGGSTGVACRGPAARGSASIALLPLRPTGLAPHAWHYFAVFVAVILALITEPLPAAAVGWIGVTFAAVLGLPFTAAQRADPAFRAAGRSVEMGAGGFHQPDGLADLRRVRFAMGYEKTGLGRRIALLLVKHLGAPDARSRLCDRARRTSRWHRSRPSNTARSAGTIFPIIRNIPELYGSRPGDSARRIGAYLMWVAFATTCVTSSMFVTALAPNLLAARDGARRARASRSPGRLVHRDSCPSARLLLLVLP